MTDQEHQERKKRATLTALRVQDRILTAEEAADYLRFTNSSTVKGLCAAGKIEAEKVQGRWRMRLSAVDRFYRSCRVVTKRESAEQADGLLCGEEG